MNPSKEAHIVLNAGSTSPRLALPDPEIAPHSP